MRRTRRRFDTLTLELSVPPIVCSPSEAAALVGRRDTIGFGLGPANPHAFLRALGEREDWEDLVLGGALLLDYYRICTLPGVSYRSGFFGPVERALVAQGHRVELVPGGFRQFGPILARFRPRVMAAQAAVPQSGRVSLSLHYGATYDELVQAGRDPDRLLVIEANVNLPHTRSLAPYDNSLPLEVVDVLVEVDHEPFALDEPGPEDADVAIARYATDFIRPEATVQIGIGGVPNVVAKNLAEGDGGGYGVHSEMFTTGLMHLHQAGKVTNTNKGQFDGVSVTTFALGSSELVRWLDDNEHVAFLPVDLVNDPTIIARNRRFVSINGAISVDLYGQIVADNINGKQISGVGGHEDFVAAADLSQEARSLICLHSTTVIDGERHSRIMPCLPRGAVVSTPRHHTDVVITEHGSAELAGLTVRDRAEALASIAHPDHRDELFAAAASLRR
jgi:acyl-CoA hydrolase